jgi:hypothetical protein
MHSYRVGLIFLLAAAATTTMLLAGCGSGSDASAKVEDSLRSYLGTAQPEGTGFPIGAGLPQVRRNACKDGHFRVQKGKLLSDRAGFYKARFPEDVALWACVVTFRSLDTPATVVVTGNNKVVWAVAVAIEGFIDTGVHVYFCTADTCARQATKAQERAALKKAQASPLVAKAVFVSKEQALENLEKEYPHKAPKSKTNPFPDSLVITAKRAANARRITALFGSWSSYGIRLVN